MFKNSKKWLAISAGVALGALGVGGLLLYKSYQNQLKQSEEGLPEWFPTWGGTNQSLRQYHSEILEPSQTYDIKLKFDESDGRFFGQSEIVFNRKPMPEELKKLSSKTKRNVYLNSFGLQVSKVIINGKAIEQDQLHELTQLSWFIILPDEHLVDGQNTVSISFMGIAGYGASGPTQWFDSKNNRYISGHTETYSNYSLFPCFEQSDFRGQFKLTFILPKNWSAVSNSKPEDPKPASELVQTIAGVKELLQEGEKTEISNLVVTRFKQTKLIPSNMISYIVGPLCKREVTSKIGLRKICIYSDQDQFERVNLIPEDFFKSVPLLMKIFENIFDVKHPFDKLDFAVFPGIGNLSEFKSTPGLCFYHSRFFDWGNSHYNQLLMRRIALHIAKIFFSAVLAGEWWTDKTILDSLCKVAVDQAVRTISQQEKQFEWAETMMDLENANYHIDWAYSFKKSNFVGQGKGLADLHNPLSEGFKWNFNIIDSSFNASIQYFEHFPQGFYNEFIKAVFKEFSWKTLSFKSLMEFLTSYMERNKIKLPHEIDHSKLMKDVIFRHNFTIVLVDQVGEQLEFTQINQYYEGKYIPLKFKIAFFNSDNECSNIQEFSLPAAEVFRVDLESIDFEYLIVDPDLKCHAIFNLGFENYTETIASAWADLDNPHRISAYKTIFFARSLLNSNEDTDESLEDNIQFVHLWKKILEDCSVEEITKYTIMTRELHYLLDFDQSKDINSPSKSKECFKILKDRAIESKKMDFLIPMIELKNNNNRDAAVELVHMITKQQEYANFDRDPSYYEIRIAYPLFTSADVEATELEQLELALKRIHPRMYGDHTFAKISTLEEMDKKIESIKELSINSKNAERRVMLCTLPMFNIQSQTKKMADMSDWIVQNCIGFLEMKDYLNIFLTLFFYGLFDQRLYYKMREIYIELRNQPDAPFFLLKYLEQNLINRRILNPSSKF